MRNIMTIGKYIVSQFYAPWKIFLYSELGYQIMRLERWKSWGKTMKCNESHVKTKKKHLLSFLGSLIQARVDCRNYFFFFIEMKMVILSSDNLDWCCWCFAFLNYEQFSITKDLFLEFVFKCKGSTKKFGSIGYQAASVHMDIFCKT